MEVSGALFELKAAPRKVIKHELRIIPVLQNADMNLDTRNLAHWRKAPDRSWMGVTWDYFVCVCPLVQECYLMIYPFFPSATTSEIPGGRYECQTSFKKM